ncbi:cation-transporting P-type ATPase [Halomicroarcula sp. GCM10025710]
MVRNKDDTPSPWSRSVSDVLERLDVSKDEGLTEEEVESRRERFGLNELHEVEQRRWLRF